MLRTAFQVLMVFISFGPAFCADEGKPSHHILMLSGSKEYKSDVSLPKWAEELGAQGYRCTIAKEMDAACLKNLQTADLMVVFCKRWELPKEQVKAIKDYIASGRPIIGLRTASHAFQTYLEFDNEILGGTYSGHTGAGEVTVALVAKNRTHPVMEGITEDWKRQGKVYYNNPTGGGKKGSPKTEFAKDNVVLMRLKQAGVDTAGTWVRTREGGQRIFYTSMGYTADFEHPSFKRMLNNAVKWCLERRKAK